MPGRPKPAVLVITSTVARGSIGGRAATFALERLGFPVWQVATVTLPWHPGQGRANRIVPDAAAFETLLSDLARSPKLGEIGGILTGYLGAPGQAAAIAGLIDAVKAARPDALYLCDPVMGDHGTLYVPQATAEAIRDHLAPRADLLTPNPTELAFLARTAPEGRDALIAAARSLKARRVAVTSAAVEADWTETLLVSADATIAARHAQITGRVTNGTGDLFAALLLARLLDGLSDAEALRLTAGGVMAALDGAVRLGTDELPLASIQDALVAPTIPVTITDDRA